MTAYLSCRDHESRNRLERAGITTEIGVGPDSAIWLAGVFPLSTLRKQYETTTALKYRISPNIPIAVIHVKERYLADQWDDVVRLIDILHAHRLHPVLLPPPACVIETTRFFAIRVNSITESSE